MTAPRRTVLVVDDDAVVVDVFRAALESAGYKVVTAAAGDEALRTLGTGAVQLAIIDVLIPKKNGFEVVSTVRQNSWGRELPIILVSGVFKARHHRATVMHRYNVIEFLDKPVEIEALVGLVDKVFSRDGEALRRPDSLPQPFQAARQWLKEDRPTPSVPLATAADSNPADEQREVEREVQAVTAPPRPAGKPASGARPGTGSHRRVSAKAPAAKTGAPPRAGSGGSTTADDAVAAATPSTSGTFDRTPFAQLLGTLARERMSGALLLERNEVKKVVYVRDGTPFMVKSNLVAECLGKLLVRERIITAPECKESLQLMKVSGRPQGETLVEMGAITAGNLRFALMLQLESKLFDVFGWTAGTYRLNRAARLPPPITELDWNGLGIVVEGVRRSYDLRRLQRELSPRLAQVVGLRAGHKDDLPLLGLSEELEAYVTAIEPATVAEIISQSTMAEFDTYRTAYALLATGVLVPTEARGARA